MKTLRPMPVLLVLLLLLAWPAHAVQIKFPEEPKLEAHVDGQGALKIIWHVPKLDPKHAGFRLTRAEVDPDKPDQDKKWQTIGEPLLRPDLREDRLKRLKLDTVLEQRPKLKQDFIDLPPEQVIAEILKQDPVEYKKMQFAGMMSIEFAIAFGTGWIDREAVEGKTYAYRVHPMLHGEGGKLKEGKLVGESILTYEVNAIKMPEVSAFKASYKKQFGWVDVSWSVAADSLKGRSDLTGFTIILGDPEKPTDRKSLPLKFGKTSEDGKRIDFNTSFQVKGEEDHRFVLTPRGKGGATGPGTEPIVLAKIGPALGSVKGLEMEAQGDDVVLTWDYEAEDPDDFAGFEITRNVTSLEDSKFEKLTEDALLPTDVRRYVDKGIAAAQPNERVMYIVRPKSADWRKDGNSSMQVEQMPKTKTLVKLGLKVKPVLKDGEPHVEVEVTAKGDPAITSYGIQKKDPEGKHWKHLGSVDPKTMKATLKPDWTRPGKTGFRVIAYAKGQDPSEPSEPVYARMPSKSKPWRPGSARVWLHEDRVEFKWEGKTSDFIKGVRILADGQVIVDETTLDREALEYTLRGKPKKLQAYTIQYIDHFGRTGDEQKCLQQNRGPEFLYEEERKKQEEAREKASKTIKKTFVERKYYDDNPDLPWIVKERAIDGNNREINHGTNTTYYRSGGVARVLTYLFDKVHGPGRRFNEDGTIKFISFKLEGETATLEEMNKVIGEDWMTEADKAWIEEKLQTDAD